MSTSSQKYFLPEPSKWPIVGSIGLFCIMLGLINWLHGHTIGHYFIAWGAMIMAFMMFGWFGTVIEESLAGLHNKQMDRTYRYGMCWFIFTEVMFFACFFGALFYARVLAGPWLGSATDSSKFMTHLVLWPDFNFHWPLLNNPDPSKFLGPEKAMGAWGLPAINTLILLTSGATITWAHHALKKVDRKHLLIGLGLTILLGVSFLFCQIHEYIHAYTELGLKLSSGIYGTTFFMLTGFHGMHVTIGTIMLIIIWLRCARGHFTPDHHFAFEAVAWYWHFVDVVWLLLFVFVYWL